MPWGHPDAFEALWCIGCGLFGREFVQRRLLQGTPLPPTARIRVCPSCHGQGVRLEGPGVEEGAFYLPPSRMPRAAADSELV